MKIAILTYWNSSNNYGQQLQMYALQTYLRNEGHDVYLVRYSPVIKKRPLWRRMLSKFNPIKILSYFKNREQNKKQSELVALNARLDVKREFDIFRKQYVKMSERVYQTIDELRTYPPEADIYISGSDQVWHDSLENPNIEGWYLNFGSDSVRRFSYAASIGRSITAKEMPIFKRLLANFDRISMRENSGVLQVKNAGFDSTLVIDPTLLLDISWYTKLLGTIPMVENPYIFVYILNVSTPAEIIADKITDYANNKLYDIKTVSSSGYTPAVELFESTKNIQATIPEWLSLIMNSQLVITTSFHGVVFSILYHKPFIAVPLMGGNSSANDRIYNLLGQLGLMDRIFDSKVPLTKQAELPIDWSEVQSKLKAMKESSLSYLDNILEKDQ